MDEAASLSRRMFLAGSPAVLAVPGFAEHASAVESPAVEENPASIGNLFPLVETYSRKVKASDSFLESQGQDVEEWKQAARREYRKLLYYQPGACDFAAQTLRKTAKDGYRQEDLTIQTAPEVRAAASLLLPERPKKSGAAIVLLHDHGGFYYAGKDKMLDMEGAPGALKAFVEKLYEPGPLGPLLARLGYVVLAIDAFYFGGRRLDPHTLPRGKAEVVLKLPEGSDEYIRESNKLGGSYESLVAKTLFMSGTTWPGILLWDDMRSVDYLMTRPEVNRERIGCFGLSLGGLRSTYLAAFHPMVRSSIVCCFMSTFPSMLRNDVEHHTWMAYVPGGAEMLDLPDVASLSVPNPRLIQYGLHDPLFPLDGKRASAEKIKRVYEKAKAGERVEAKFYDAPHMVSKQMGEDAVAWFERTLA